MAGVAIQVQVAIAYFRVVHQGVVGQPRPPAALFSFREAPLSSVFTTPPPKTRYPIISTGRHADQAPRLPGPDRPPTRAPYTPVRPPAASRCSTEASEALSSILRGKLASTWADRAGAAGVRPRCPQGKEPSGSSITLQLPTGTAPSPGSRGRPPAASAPIRRQARAPQDGRCWSSTQ